MFIANSGSTSHMVNSLKNTTKPREIKIVAKTENKKMTTGLL